MIISLRNQSNVLLVDQNHRTQFLSCLIASAVRLGRTFALWFAGFGSAPTTSTDLSSGTGENSIACSAKMDIKVTLCPDMILVLFEVVFLPQGALKYFVECNSILFR